ncbi:hypothetical protein KVR01_001733 [Diaporthe batatas]|uniref:uncharacterized protein n=1 Tax=Diaporthe batatas TaxID=748121 RepID=UPI001D03B061|nr:uncharacterized protein KVR01_001733 [Diaporthe batatas]KAG8168984.1 hypothetical protein KVR01_001733 [Diaporthe batatas]
MHIRRKKQDAHATPVTVLVAKMARIFARVKKVFSRPKNLEPASSNASSIDTSSAASRRPSTAAPSYHHAAAVQPPAYRSPPHLHDDGTTSTSPAPTTFQQQASHIAHFQVGGMRRTRDGSSYLSSYESTQTSGASSSGWTRPSYASAGATTMTSHGHDSNTALDTTEKKHMHYPSHRQHATSTWQGKPNGTAYDRREELTEEDEDTWARLMM